MPKSDKQYLRVAVVWNGTISDERVFKKATKVVVGEDKGSTFIIPAQGIPDQFVLLEPSGKESYTLHLKDSMTGRIALKDQPVPMAEFLASGKATKVGDEYQVEVGPDDWGVVVIGNVGLFFQFVTQADKIAALPWWQRVDYALLATILISAMLQISFILVGRLMFSDQLKMGAYEIPDRFVKFMIEKPKEEPEPEEEIIERDDSVGKKAGGKEGKFGMKDAKVRLSKVPRRDGEMVKRIKDYGIHKALGSNLLGQGPLKQIFGDRTGFDSSMAVAMSGHGDQLIVGQGSGGMGFRGTGTGGGGSGFGRVWGMGRIDTGGGRGVKAGLSGKRRKKVRASVRRGKSSVQGFCKAADIQRVVSARSAGIKFCYEKELQRNPSLAGKVVLNWLINPQGRVTRVYVVSSTLNSPRVEQCMMRQVRRWRFTKPEGGQCSVNFPFVFRGGL